MTAPSSVDLFHRQAEGCVMPTPTVPLIWEEDGAVVLEWICGERHAICFVQKDGQCEYVMKIGNEFFPGTSSDVTGLMNYLEDM